ncbi:MAG: hypothetical protein HY314_12425 [Acidobacteria bacterium]|nr:hypothetical protein [Acidobacteriota bacterium]
MRRNVTVLFSVLLFIFGVFSLAGLNPRAQGGPTITTLAGGNVGDGRVAAEALLNHPADVVVDAQGNIYVAEEFYDRVRRIDAVTGIITTVAGNGVSGFSGDGGQAINASLNKPEGIAVDAAGNLYIADFNNHRVRRVDPSGVITSVAGDGFTDKDGNGRFRGDGGPATQASLSKPRGVAVDSLGNLYISDWGNNRIRKVDMASRVITTFAGDGKDTAAGDGGPASKASLNPAGLAFDAMGNLYVADFSNHLIRKIEKATGNISTVAGDGSKVLCDLRNDPCSCGFAGNGKFDADSGPAKLLSLNFPQDVAVGVQGDVYIADTANHRVRRLTSDGMITTIAGTSPVDRYGLGTGGYEGDSGPAIMAKFNRPTGAAVDAAGNVIVADYENDRLRVVDAAGMITALAGGPVSFGDGGPVAQAATYTPQAVAVDAEGNVFFAEPATGRVRRIDARTGMITTVAGNGIIEYSGDGGPATQAGLAGPIGLAVDSKGDLYISELLGMRVRKVEKATGIITTYAGNGVDGFSGDGGLATQAQLNVPRGLAFDANDNLYIADSCNHRIRRVDTRGIITTVAGTGAPAPPNACTSEATCRGVYDGDGKPATQSSLSSPIDVAVDGNGNIIIADTLNFRIRMVDAGTGKISTLAGDGHFGDRGDSGPAGQARFRIAYAVAVDKMGDILIADFNMNGNRIRRIDRSGRTPTISTIAGTGALGFSGDGGPATEATMRGPSDIAVMPDGGFVFTDTFNHRVRRVL